MSELNKYRIWYAAQPRALRAVLTINVVLYLVWQLLLSHIPVTRDFVWNHLALNPGMPGILTEPWQMVTYSFLHLSSGIQGLIHIGMNLLWLVWIGRDLEELQGPACLLGTYLLGAVGGALLTVLLGAAFPGVALFSGVVHGASGAVLGVMTMLAVLYPYKRIALLFIGSVRLLHVVVAFLLLDVLFFTGGTSVSAHLGGVLAGLSMARLQQLGRDTTSWAGIFFGARRSRTSRTSRAAGPGPGVLDRMEGWLAGRKSKPAPLRKVDVSRARNVSRGRPAPAEEVAAAAVDTVPDIDAILDKISAKGYDALTPEEKRVLYNASRN